MITPASLRFGCCSVEIAVLEPITALATILLLEIHPLSVGKYPDLYSRSIKSFTLSNV